MMKKSNRLSGEDLLLTLGISNPTEIDVEAIAAACNARVQYRPLSGCEATILGVEDKAIITVNKNSHPARKRFSVGHELGHWCNDRGKVASHSCDENALTRAWSPRDPEYRANQFAAELLLPRFMLREVLSEKSVTFDSVREIKEKYSTSLTATAIRMVQVGEYPSMVLLVGRSGVRWHIRNPSVPRAFFVEQNISAETGAYQILSGNAGHKSEVIETLPSDHWYNVRMEGRYDIVENSLKLSNDLVLTLLWWEDESQIIDFENAEKDEDYREPRW